jgi:hypothetical protein
MSWHSLTKEFYDYADDIAGVTIHYFWTPLEELPDWENQRITRVMPPVRVPEFGQSNRVTPPRLRRKLLKLPVQIPAGSNGGRTWSLSTASLFRSVSGRAARVFAVI